MKRITCRVLKALIILLVVLYLLMLFSTNTILRSFKDCVRGNLIEENEECGCLNRYKISDTIEYDELDIKIRRVFVAHNFFDGIMIVDYSIMATSDNRLTYYSSTDFPFYLSKWKIHRGEDGWIVVEIEESP